MIIFLHDYSELMSINKYMVIQVNIINKTMGNNTNISCIYGIWLNIF